MLNVISTIAIRLSRSIFHRERGILGLIFIGLIFGSVASHASIDENDAPKTHTVIIKRFKFVPETLTIKAGDTVVWINKDLAPHTATSDVEEDRWDTERLNKNEEKAITFTDIGSQKYFCLYHPNMRGEIIVEKSE
jgi:plastocyanin